MNEYAVVTFALAGIVVIMLLFGICYALFEIACFSVSFSICMGG